MQPRRGFTLVELLVVIAVIAILVALLIPAVQSAREAARRITCANHLKQFALSVGNYAAAHDDYMPPVAMEFYDRSGRTPLPKGWTDCDAWGERHSHGWRVALLPFLEEQNLYDGFDFSVGNLTEVNMPVISQVLPVFQCPSTPGYPRSLIPLTSAASGIEAPTIPADLHVGAWDYGVPAILRGSEFTAAWNGLKNPQSSLRRRSSREPCLFAREYGPAKQDRLAAAALQVSNNLSNP